MRASLPPLFGSSVRRWLAWLRLALLFAIGCWLALAGGLLARELREQSDGPATPLPTAGATPPFLGVTLEPAWMAPDHLQRTMNELAETGFGWVRLRLGWDQIQPAPGQWMWAQTDGWLEAAHQAGLTPVVVLDGSPAWTRAPQDQTGPDAPLAPPANFEEYARFAAAVAARYGEHVRFYQLWDEPNIAPHWGARHVDPVGYTRLVKSAAPAVRRADPNAVILLAALAPTGDRGHTALDEVTFLERVYAAGAAPDFDAVAVQPFGFGYTPDDPHQERTVLNFRRALLVRRAMAAAGDGATPVWLVRYGWNRALNSPFATVTPARQVEFARRALEIGYEQWPWVAAQGWAAHTPAAAADDPLAGFSLTPALAATFRAWAQAAGNRPVSVRAPANNIPLLAGWVVWGALALVWFWRTAAALRATGRPGLPERLAARPVWQFATLWAAVILVYYWATWPPLIALCWAAAAVLIAARPTVGLGLALALLPFYFQHKEVRLVNNVWVVPPSDAVLLCMMPVLLLALRRRGAAGPESFLASLGMTGQATGIVGHAASVTAVGRAGGKAERQAGSLTYMLRDPWWTLAGAWLLVTALGATGVWHWPGYWRGVVELVLVPLAFFGLLRGRRLEPRHRQGLAGALVMGGVLAALVGLAGWLQGGGTSADGLRRLVGPVFSPNHMALLLERSLYLGLGLALVATGRWRTGWLAGCGVMAVALALTGSRGALLLGMPAGLAALALLGPGVGARLRRLPRSWWLTGLVVGLMAAAALGWLLWPRLSNSATVQERLAIWSATLALWRDFPLFGVGPNGFFWRFPAYIPLDSALDPNLRHPHNLWLEMVAQGGVAALVWLGGLLALGYSYLRRRRGALSWPEAGLIAALVAGLAHGQVDAFQALPDLAAWNWSALALLLAWQEDC
jgi:O-antigen ligase